MNERIKAGADIHAGDGGYSIGTQEKYDEFVKVRNQSLGKMRIKELAEQAHCYACEYARRPDYSPHNPYNQLMYKQRYDSKFAELIVGECVFAVENHGGMCGVTSSKKIREHFGVEDER